MRKIRLFTKIIAAFVCAFLFVNMLCCFYERPSGWINTPNGSSRGIRNPNSILVHGTEGYGYAKIDSNGYINDDKPLGKSYVLMMGASHSQGKEVLPDKRYSAIVNKQLAYKYDNDQVMYAYNIASDGHFLAGIIQHFKAAVSAFPDASCITIELGSTDCSIEKLRNAVSYPSEFNGVTANEAFKNLDNSSKLKNIVKEYLPLVPLIDYNLESAQNNNSDDDSTEKVDIVEYESILYDAMSELKDIYGGPIVILYHPNTKILESGQIEIVRSDTIGSFTKVCNEVGIDIIDYGNAFVELYHERNLLPYGFSNTSYGKGHLNAWGHSIIANGILDYLEEKIQQ